MFSTARKFIVLALFSVSLLLSQQSWAESLKLSCDDSGNLKSAQSGGGVFSYSAKHEELKLLRESANVTCQGVMNCFSDLRQLRSDIGGSADVIERFALGLAKDSTRSNSRERILSDLNRLQQTLSSCEFVRSKATDSPSKEHIALSYPFKGPNKSKTGTNYDKARIERAVRLALLNGVDPNLALGILLTENSPVDSKQSEDYAKKYGLLPINAVPAYEYLGCLAPKPKTGSHRYASSQDADLLLDAMRPRLALEKQQSTLGDRIAPELIKLDSKMARDRSGWKKLYREKCAHPVLTARTKVCSSLRKYLDYTKQIETESAKIEKAAGKLGGGDPARAELAYRELSCEAGCAAFLVPQKDVPSFEVRTDNGPYTQYKLCAPDRTISYASSPTFELDQKSRSAVSCCAYVHASEKSNPASVAEDTKSALALKFMNEKIHSRKENGLSVSHLIQTYNGTGRLGVTEKLKNSCLSGLDMGETPVYGAKVADLMVNSIMNNPEIQSIIQHAAAEFGMPVRSLFCEKMGKGSHSIAADSFYKEQRRYLLEKSPTRRDACAPLFK